MAEHKLEHDGAPEAPGPDIVEQAGAPESGAAPSASAQSPVGRGSKRPRRGRVAIEFAECSLGEIMNISPTGLRARYKGARANLPEVDQRFGMQVQTPDGPVQVRARVAWTKRVGLRTFDIGVQFVAADDKDTVKLKQLAAMAGRSIIINETTGGARLRAG